MAERLNAAVLKTVVLSRVPGVRISPSPPLLKFNIKLNINIQRRSRLGVIPPAPCTCRVPGYNSRTGEKMKSLLTLGLFLSIFSTFASATEVDVKLIYKNAKNGFANVAGTVTAENLSDITITLQNGQLSYTTLPDAKGNFAVVFEYRGSQFDVTAWKKDKPEVALFTFRDTLKK